MTLDERTLPEFMTPTDVKRFLNLKSSTWTVRKLGERFGLVFFKVGKGWYIHRGKFLEAFRKKYGMEDL